MIIISSFYEYSNITNKSLSSEGIQLFYICIYFIFIYYCKFPFVTNLSADFYYLLLLLKVCLHPTMELYKGSRK